MARWREDERLSRVEKVMSIKKLVPPEDLVQEVSRENPPTMRQVKALGDSLGIEISNFFMYSDGFSFTVGTELEAYKVAYKYQPTRTVVRFAPNVGKWSVQIYTRSR